MGGGGGGKGKGREAVGWAERESVRSYAERGSGEAVGQAEGGLVYFPCRILPLVLT